jgi:hypothetical protein
LEIEYFAYVVEELEIIIDRRVFVSFLSEIVKECVCICFGEVSMFEVVFYPHKDPSTRFKCFGFAMCFVYKVRLKLIPLDRDSHIK